jgi:hypothetical protein
MCGILGIIQRSSLNKKKFLEFEFLLKLSESRGKEASGLCLVSGSKFNKINIVRSNLSPSEFINHKEYQFFKKNFDFRNTDKSIMIGHTRMTTDGNENNENNNQPVHTNNLVGVHNGIICNFKELANKFKISKEVELDSDVLFRLIDQTVFEGQTKKSLQTGIRDIFKIIEGVANVAILNKNNNNLFLATNNGSLYFYKEGNIFLFASEEIIIRKFLKKYEKKSFFLKITKIQPNQIFLFDYEKFEHQLFSQTSLDVEGKFVNNQKDTLIKNIISKEFLSKRININKTDFSKLEKDFEFFQDKFNHVKRCTNCILSEKVPFIYFDKNGVCNFCKFHQPIKYKSIEEGKKYLEKKTKGKKNNCLMAISGGRDSCYGLHEMINTFDTIPLAFTYDWGMITDLGRRNISRMCAKLGVEHILIAADIRKKRANIKKNVLAWLSKPNIGIVPLFMAGDKHFFWYANKLKKEYSLDLDIWCFNPFEITTFKDDLSGIKMWDISKDYMSQTHEVRTSKKILYGFFYLLQFLKNPAYLNNSLLDTFTAYLSYYFIKKNYFSLYDYCEWDEQKINSTLIKNYNWEVDPDMPTNTWRIGDASSYFYNYIYFCTLGFTEIEFLRSRQIREGKKNRSDVLELIKQENKPNYKTIEWYCNKIDINFYDTINKINNFGKNYK